MLNRIVVNGETIAIIENVVYIKKHEQNGAYYGVSENEATGIAVRGEPYSLFGLTLDPDRELPEALICPVDAGDYAEVANTALDSANGLANALCEEDSELTDRITTLENALCELDT